MRARTAITAMLRRIIWGLAAIGLVVASDSWVVPAPAAAAAPAWFALTAPVAGAVVHPAQSVAVRWTGGDPSMLVDVLLIDRTLFTDANGVVRPINTVVETAAHAVPNTGAFDWTFPSDLPFAGPIGHTYQFYVQDTPNTSMWTYGAEFTVERAPALPSTDTVYVADNGAGRIVKIAPDGTSSVFASPGAGVWDFAFDGAGNLYAGHVGDGRIEKFSPSGASLGVFATMGSSGPNAPTGLAFDAAGNLYAADANDNTVKMFTPAGVRSVFARGGLSYPTGLAFDAAGNLYVANTNANSIRKFSPSGADLGDFAGSGGASPFGLAFDGAGNLFVANATAGPSAIVKITPAGVGSVFANVRSPVGVAFDSAGVLYATVGGTSVQRYSPTGTDLGAFATGLSGPMFLEIRGPTPPVCITPPPGLVGWWTGDGNAQDLVGGNHGRFDASVVGFAAGRVGQAFALGEGPVFHPSSPGIDVGNAPALHLSRGDFTVELWFNYTRLGDRGQAPLVIKMAAAPNLDGWNFAADGPIFRTGGGDRNTGTQVSLVANLRPGVWYHAAAVRRGGTIELYLNGGEATASVPIDVFHDTNTADVYFGYDTTQRDRYFGLLDEISLYNRALTPAEIKAVYDAGSAGKCKTPPDTTAPTLSITSPAQNAVLGNAAAAVTVSVEDVAATTVRVGTATANLAAGGGTASLEVTLVEGTNSIPVSATDQAGNTTSTTLTLVLDVDGPVVRIDAPTAGQVFGPDASPVAVMAHVDDLTAVSVHSVPAGIVANLPAGGGVVTGALALSEGPNTIMIQATDAAGRVGSAAIVVTLDTTPPALHGVPGDVTVEATNAAGAVVTYPAPTATDSVDPAPRVTCSPASGTAFAIGTTTVICTATDARGNRSTGSFTVTVRDTTPPSLTAPADITVLVGEPVTIGVATASDASGAVTVENDAPALFPAGTTIVTWMATDVHGLQTSATQRVTVVTAAQATQALATSVQALVDGEALLPANGEPLQAKLAQAAKAASAGNKTAASNSLGAFVNQVRALVKTGKLTAAQGEVLIDAADAIVRSLATGG